MLHILQIEWCCKHLGKVFTFVRHGEANVKIVPPPFKRGPMLFIFQTAPCLPAAISQQQTIATPLSLSDAIHRNPDQKALPKI